MACFKRTKNSGGYFQKNWVGCAARFLKTYPISDQNLWFSLPYFRTWSKIWYPILDLKHWSPVRDRSYGKLRQVHGSWRKMVLSPNDEVANSSKKHTQFKTGRHKPFPVSDQNGRNLCPVSTSGAAHSYAAYIRDYRRGEKRFADYESRCLRKRD